VVAAPGARLELVAYNVLYRNRSYDEVIDWLRASRADVVVVVEAGGEWGRRIAKADLPFTVTSAEGEGPGDGLVILTRAAPLTAEILRLGTRPAIALTLPLGDGHVRVLGVHPFAPTTPRGALLQEEEFEAIARWADPADGPVVVAGDLNATPWYPAFPDLLRGGLHDSSRGFGWQPTWSAGPLAMPIDHVLHSEDLTVHTRTTGPRMGSDHRPLTVVLARGG
jgi:endonuclease/exonuclease/phosphatase (EEP) superfamily protein YafD